MWESLKTRATDFTAGGRFKRRGAKLGILIAIMMTLPGLVAATSFISVPTASNSLTSTESGQPSASCGFKAAGSTDTAYVPTLSGTPDGNGLIATATVTVNVLEATGTSGYEYLEGEIVWACDSTPSSVTSISAAITISGTGVSGVTSTSADWAALFLTSDSATTTSDAAIGNWCIPTTQTVSGGACSATAPTACTYTSSAFTPSLYPPENKALGAQSTSNTWVWVNGVVGGAQTSASSGCGGSALPGTVTIARGLASVTYYEDIGFGFGDMPSSITSVSWVLSSTVTITP